MLSRENSTAADDPLSRLEFCKGEIDRLAVRRRAVFEVANLVAPQDSTPLPLGALSCSRLDRD
jgi:hypothetical protein